MSRRKVLSLNAILRFAKTKRPCIFSAIPCEPRNGRSTEHRFDLTFRTLSVRQMTRQLERAGFRVDAVLGDYRGRPWDERADVWIILAKKR